jgi:hypothetical protein
MALRRQGRKAETEQLLAKAHDLYRQILDGNPERLSQQWHEPARLELALKRAGEPR